MGMFDTFILPTEFYSPYSGTSFSDVQTKMFKCSLIEYKVGDKIPDVPSNTILILEAVVFPRRLQFEEFPVIFLIEDGVYKAADIFYHRIAEKMKYNFILYMVRPEIDAYHLNVRRGV